jgi:hypothetical protein
MVTTKLLIEVSKDLEIQVMKNRNMKICDEIMFQYICSFFEARHPFDYFNGTLLSIISKIISPFGISVKKKFMGEFQFKRK